jgi:hypothetical protein
VKSCEAVSAVILDAISGARVPADSSPGG